MSRRATALACGVIAALVVGTVAPAMAQTTERTGRPFRGLFGGSTGRDPERPREELNLTASFLAGYDDNVAAEASGGGGIQPSRPERAGYLGNADLALHYYRGRQIQSVTIDANGFVASYGEGLGVIGGGDLGFAGVRQVGRRDSVRAFATVLYEPLLTLGSFSPLSGGDGAVPSPETSAFAGIVEQRSFSTNAGTGYGWVPGRRDRINFDYGFQAQRYLNVDDGIGNSHAHRGSVQYVRQVSRYGNFRSSYRYSDGRYEDVEGTRPMTQQTIEAGPFYDRGLSRSRRVQASFGLGAQHVKTLASGPAGRSDLEFWTPFASATLGAALSNTFRLTGDYRRGTALLSAVTAETYVTDALTVGAETLVADRLDLSTSVGFATGASADATGSAAGYRTATVTSALRYALGRRVALLFNYYYYDYRFTDTNDLPVGFRPTATRHTFRVGATFWLPLLGSYLDTPSRRP